MRIGIDARWLHETLSHSDEKEMLAGIGNYSYHLIKNLINIDRKNEYIVFIYKDRPFDHLRPLTDGYKNVEFRLLPLPWRDSLAKKVKLSSFMRNFQEQFWTIPKVRKEKLDIFHSLHQGVRPYPGAALATAVTIHDLIYSVFPEQFFNSEMTKWRWNRHVKKLGQADMIIAISENTRLDIIKYAKIYPKKIRIIHYGLSKEFRPVDNEELVNETLNKYHIEPPFILYVGGLQPNKNVERILQAYKFLRQKIRANIGLVLVGGFKFVPEYLSELNALLDSLFLRRYVTLPGWIPHSDLIKVYSAASLLVHPALYEGFGFTPLEAMGCGCPVVVSEIAPLPEVVGKAGLYVNPYRINEIASAMQRLTTDEELRKKLTKEGLQRARLFSWKKAAKQTLSAYEEVSRRQ